MPYIGKSPTGSGVRQRFHFTAAGGETSLSGADDNSKTLKFTDGEFLDVYLNGVLLVQGTDYGVGTTNTISSLAALSAGDIVEIIVYDIFNVAKINSEAIRARHYYTATGSETSIGTAQIAGLSFAANADIDVSLNGVTLVAGTDYNTTTANTVGGLSALSAGNVVEIVIYEKFQLADTVSKASGGTFNGPVTFNGQILTPARPAFSGIKVASSSNTGATGDIVFDTVSFNIGSHYNTSSGVFVVPVTGIYRFYFAGFFSASDGTRAPANQSNTINLMTNASGSFVAYAGTTQNCTSSALYSSASFSGLIQATANEQLKITASNHIFVAVAGSPEFAPRFSIELAG